MNTKGRATGRASHSREVRGLTRARPIQCEPIRIAASISASRAIVEATALGTPTLAQDLALVHEIAGRRRRAFVIETVLAFFLVTVGFSPAVASRAGNLAPFTLGMTLTLNIIMGGVLTGAAFNPARAISNASYMKVTQKPRGTARFRRYELVSVTPRSLSLLRAREEITAARPPPSRRDLPSSRLSSQVASRRLRSCRARFGAPSPR
jgi:hypothetical protein